MKHTSLNQARVTFVTCTLFLTATLSAQTPFWRNNGNNSGSSDFLGTTNNQPLVLKANGTEGLRLLTDGTVRINSFSALGNGVVTSSNGVLGFKAFPNDTNQVFTGSGSFRSISTLSGWTRTGNVLYNAPGVNVGIGITNPVYPLEVQGSAFFHGTIYADGVVLADKMLVDTLKTGVMFTLNNNLYMRGGSLNELYTASGDLRIQSNPLCTGNTIFNAGVNGFVGIGTYNPAYKLDVSGTVRFQNDVYLTRIRPQPGDTVVIIGDSSIAFGFWGGCNHIQPVQRGLGIGGNTAFGRGTNSIAIGAKVVAELNAPNAIVIGSGVMNGSGTLVNNTPNSLMIGFNSTLPTIFVAPASGAGALGKVGIGTTSPEALLQINNDNNKIVFDAAGTNTVGFAGYAGFNVIRDAGSGLFTAHGDGAHNAGSVIAQDNDGGLHFFIFDNTGTTDQGLDPVHVEQLSIMTLRRDRVQIGQNILSTSSPYNNLGTKLSVDGRVLCKDLVVSDVDWQDEVFDSTYTLLPLDSVSAYIAQNGHLPNVKPQEDVEQNGMSVAETDAMQQQKIEELTLYILQLDARLKSLEEENAQLKKENSGQQPK